MMRTVMMTAVLMLTASAAVAQPPDAMLPAAAPAPTPVVSTSVAAPAPLAPPQTLPAVGAAGYPSSAPSDSDYGDYSESAPPTGFGAETKTWVELQASGAAAANEPRPMPGEIATRVYERYLKSFEYPIPEHFTTNSFGGTSSASGSTGASGGSGGGY